MAQNIKCNKCNNATHLMTEKVDSWQITIFQNVPIKLIFCGGSRVFSRIYRFFCKT